jgi:hypothetical protein
MSIAPRPIDISLFSSDGRSGQRFPLSLAVQYRVLGRTERCGTGLSRNVGSSGALIRVAGEVAGQAAERQPWSNSIEPTMSWPCLPDGACERTCIAIEARQYEFRTAGLAGGGHRQNVTFFLPKT